MASLICAKLTPDLFEVFLSYKKATTKVERWLATNWERKIPERLTISQLQEAAFYVKKKGIKVPDLIYNALDTAITARSEVTTHFRILFATGTNEAKNRSHEHFTKILKVIFKSLCSDRLCSSKAQRGLPSKISDSNPFQTLSTLKIDNEPPSTNGDETDEMHCGHEHSTTDNAENNGIKDDAVVQDLDLHFALWDLETTCAKVKTYWTETAAGRMPVMLAAFLTNGAIANVATRFRYGSRFFDTYDVTEFDGDPEKFRSSTLAIHEKFGSSDATVTKAFRLEMHAPFLAIILCQQGKDNCAVQPPGKINEKPQDYILPLDEPSNSPRRVHSELKVFGSLLRSIKQLAPSDRQDQYGLVMGFHPDIGMPDLDEFSRPVPTSATYVLRLIVESYKSWCILPGGGRNVLSCRINALKFAQSVHRSVKCFRLSEPFEQTPGCDCTYCRDNHLMECLRRFESDLTTFMSEKRWDTYHQSPVVAGYQMTRILARATNLGIWFCNFSRYVGVVLHLYNCLRQFDIIHEESVLLEHLCDAIGHSIFRGPRPASKFYSHYAVFQRMALNFDDRRRKFHFGESKTDEGRIYPHTLSVMTGLNDCGFRRLCHRWRPVWQGSDKYRGFTNEGVQKTAEQIAAHPLVCVLEPLESIVRSEWEGEFPVARINWFEVFTACTDILEKMSAVHCTDPKDLLSVHFHFTRDDKFDCGRSRVHSLLEKAQQLDMPAFKMICATDIKSAKNAICEIFKDRKTAQFLWDL